jgi:hypothetical protein
MRTNVANEAPSPTTPITNCAALILRCYQRGNAMSSERLARHISTDRYLSAAGTHTSTSNWRSQPNLEAHCISRQRQTIGWNASRSCKGTCWKELTAVRPPRTTAADRWHGTALDSSPSWKEPAVAAIL